VERNKKEKEYTKERIKVTKKVKKTLLRTERKG
jgi:hypothetical protein